MNVRLAIPLLIQEVWLRHQEKDAKPPQRRRRGGWECDLDHPVRSIKGGFAISFGCRVHPSYVRRGVARLPIHSHLLQMRGAWIFAPDAERLLNGTIREAEEYRLRLRLMRHGIPGGCNKDIVIFPVECSVADLRTAAAFDNAIHGRVGCAMRRTQKTGRQKLNESADRRHRISACGRIDVLHLDPVTR